MTDENQAAKHEAQAGLCSNCAADGKCMKRQALCAANGTAPSPAEAPEIGEVTWQQAADAIEDLDDYARMMVGVDPAGPRETLYRFLEQAKAALASNVQPKGTPAAVPMCSEQAVQHGFVSHVPVQGSQP